MRLLLLALLCALSYAQTEMYSSVSSYNKASAADASAACAGEGMQLCTVGQLFNAVFNLGWGDLCYSGWLADEYEGQSAGWFNANGNCGDIGWNDWTPSNPGSHCCDASLAEVTAQSCASFDAGTCLAQGDKIIIDDAASMWCASGSCDIATCCQDFVAAPEYITLPESFPKYTYSNAEDADAACQAKHPDLRLCTKNQVRDLAETNSICASGWWVTEKDGDNNIVGSDRGWYTGEAFADSCSGGAGEQSWKPSSGNGAAHCCVPSYRQSGYRVIGDFGDYSRATAEVYCAAQGYSYQLCSKDQLQTISQEEMPSICMSGYMTDDEGWWQGDVEVSGCGTKGTFNTWVHPRYPGAHCCMSYVTLEYIPLEPYGILPESGAYGQSSYSNGASAEAACMDRGYDQLCSIGQQAYVEENQDIYGTIKCKVGWATDGSGGYDSGYWSGCGKVDTWNNEWQPAGNPLAHCCFADVLELTMTQYPYYNGGWATYSTQDEAASYCTEDYSLCSVAQLQALATTGVTYNDVYQLEDSICKFGYTSDGEKGWWQTQPNQCGTPGWRTYGDPTLAATYHCCLPFEAEAATTEPPTFLAFIQHPSSGYPYMFAGAALAGCQEVNAQYSLCADYEIIQMANEGVVGDDEFLSVERQPNLCHSAWTDPDRSLEYMFGWYVSADGTCSGGEGWKSWQQSGTNSGAYCCYAPHFDLPSDTVEPTETSSSSSSTDAPETTPAPTDARTDAPETTPAPTDARTDAPETTPAPTETSSSSAPVDPEDTLPSTVASPSDCVDTGFEVEGFPNVNFCSSAGTVYLNGRDTCVPSSGDETETYDALQNVWEDDWYLAADGCTADKTYDEATVDQLWITNEMCNNLEEDISELESSTSNYMDGWTQAVIDLVNAQKSNFNEDTQQALDEYLATLQNGDR